MDEKKYIGQKEIASSALSATKHRDSIDLTDVTYTDGTKETIPTKLFDASVTTTPADATQIRDIVIDAVTKELLVVLLSWGIKLEDVPYTSQVLAFKLTESINQALRTAAGKLWGKDTHDLNLLDVDNVLIDRVTVGDIVKENS